MHFVNTTITATVKVCKYLTTGSDALAGQTFNYSYDRTAARRARSRIVAQSGSAGACKIIGGTQWPTAFPVGSTITVTEDLSGYPYVSGDGNPRGTADQQSSWSWAASTPCSFHNQALGQLEICKSMLVDNKNGIDDTNFNNRAVFHFSIDGKGDYAVAAGHCSMPIIVNAGSHTVQENLAKSQVFGSEHPTGQTGSARLRVRLLDGHRPDGRQPRDERQRQQRRQPDHGQRAVLQRSGERRRDARHVHEPRPAVPDQGLQGRRVRLGDAAPAVRRHLRAAPSRRGPTAARRWSRLSNGQCTGLLTQQQPAGRLAGHRRRRRLHDRHARRDAAPGRTSSRPRRWTTPGPARVEPRSVAPRPDTVTWHPGIGVNVITITNKYRAHGVSSTP